MSKAFVAFASTGTTTMLVAGASTVAIGRNLTNRSIVGWLEDQIIKTWFELALPAAMCSIGEDTQIP